MSNGPNVYDACDVCGGDGTVAFGLLCVCLCVVCVADPVSCALAQSCLDCTGTMMGTAVYDKCDVCGGTDTTCFDCAGELNGPYTYDACDVCGGDSRSCLDCSGVPNGPSVYDSCNVCDGDG